MSPFIAFQVRNLLKFFELSVCHGRSIKFYPLFMNYSSFDAANWPGTILIVGAGAAGLMAARLLSAAGRKVLVVEAGNEAGGRVRTLKEADFPLPVEAGAEFVHGDLPLTLELLKIADIPFHPVGGKMINVRKERQAGRS